MNALVCPLCNTPFDLPGVPGRVVCPRCGEAIPAKLLPAIAGGSVAAAVDRPAPPEIAPGTSLRRIVQAVAVLFAAVAVAIGAVRYFKDDPKPDATPPMAIPLPTRPPMSLAALRHFPPDTQILAAFQTSPLIQYANRIDRKPEVLLVELGLPVALFEGLAKAGIPLDQIDHIAVGASLAESMKLSVALMLREPIRSESAFREALKARQNADKPGRSRVDLPGLPLPLDLHKFDGTTYLFSSDATALDAMLKPQENAEFLRPGLRESIGKLDPSSFAWLATDNQNWAELPTLKLLAALAKREDLPKRLKGIRALTTGLGLSSDLSGTTAVRLADAEAIREFEAKARTRIAGPNTQMTADGDWRIVRVTGLTPAVGLPGMRSLFEP